MEMSEFLDEVERLHAEARQRGLFFQYAEDDEISGMRVQVRGRSLLSFGSCSYLGLEKHPALIEGVHRAVDRYGTQFSCSRGYLSAPDYDELEDAFSQIFEGHVLVAPSTTMAHQIALPVLVTEKDAVVMDHQVHHSVQIAANHVRAAGATVRIVRHGELAQAVDVIADLAKKHRTVWFCLDGVYSMFGDLAPIWLIEEVLAIAPNVRIYVDDAHGMSWAGKHGRGSFLAQVPLQERVVVATSLAKAFACGGGLLVFADPKEAERVRMCGGPMVFSGPLQPPMLGAALASARLHLTGELVERQQILASRVDLLNRELSSTGFPPLAINQTPIFFLRCGLPRVAFRVCEAMQDEGYFLNVSMFPSVPMRRAGIRLALTAQHSEADVLGLVDGLKRHYLDALAAEGVTAAELDELFGGAVPKQDLAARRARAFADVFEGRATTLTATARPTAAPDVALRVEHVRSIRELDAAEWDGLLGEVGAISATSLAMLEDVYRDNPRPEHNWDFHYFVVRDPEGRPVAATMFTEALGKDDMLARETVSRVVEHYRQSEPYFLTSRAWSMGGGFSEGRHLWLDRAGPWRPALDALMQAVSEAFERSDATILVLREFDPEDAELDAALAHWGFLKVPVLDSHEVAIDWTSNDEMLSRLTKRSRQRLRPVYDDAHKWRRVVWGKHGQPPTAALIDHMERLYAAVAARKFRINVFAFPRKLFEAFFENEAWEVVTLHLDPAHGGPEDERPVAWFAAHRHGTSYAPILPGLEYKYVFEHAGYWHTLRTVIERAAEIGIRRVHLGMDADFQKSRFGSRIDGNIVYAQGKDSFNAELLREIIATIGTQPPRLDDEPDA